MLAVVRRKVGLAALGTLLSVLLIVGGYRFGPSASGGWSSALAGTAVVLGWCVLLVVAFMIVVPALLPHK